MMILMSIKRVWFENNPAEDGHTHLYVTSSPEESPKMEEEPKLSRQNFHLMLLFFRKVMTWME